MGTIVIAVAVAVTAIIVAPITWFAAVTHRKNAYESKIGSAEEKSREIIDEALKTAETKKREALLEAKEESIRTKNELDKETKPNSEGVVLFGENGIIKQKKEDKCE